jgi:hypothetical protein
MVHHSSFQIFHLSSFQICRPSPFVITNCSAEFDKSTNYSINADLKNMIQRLTLTKLFIFIHFCFFCYQTWFLFLFLFNELSISAFFDFSKKKKLFFDFFILLFFYCTQYIFPYMCFCKN